jgi:glycine dehydrogenase subunit 1
MSYVPNTDADRAAMLEAIGVGGIADLFRDVPEVVRFPQLDLPTPVSEWEVLRELKELSEYNVDLEHAPCFLGAGAYRHFVPSVVGHVIGRSEFYTAYTPYQPEISQGTLQSIFEYQSMICALTGMTGLPRWPRQWSWRSMLDAAGGARWSSPRECTLSTGPWSEHTLRALV